VGGSSTRLVAPGLRSNRDRCEIDADYSAIHCVMATILRAPGVLCENVVLTTPATPLRRCTSEGCESWVRSGFRQLHCLPCQLDVLRWRSQRGRRSGWYG
jgi:hypothetical protein